MALKARISADAWSKLPPHFQSEYAAKDGKYVLAVEPDETFGLEDVGGLKSALSEEREARRQAATALKAFEGLDPAAARAALDRQKAGAQIADDRMRAEIEAREKAVAEKFGRDLETEKARVARMSKQLERTLVDAAATSAIASAKGNVDLLMPHVRSAVKVIEDPATGELSVRIVDAKGVERITNKSGSRDPMGIAEFVDTLRSSESFAPAFSAPPATGGGFQGSARSSGAGAPIMLSEAEARRDPRNYEAAKAQAAKAGVPLLLTN